MNIHNPFIISGYHGPEYFCDREKETLRIISAINNNRNLTLISLRRMGKTGLINHVFNKLSKQKDINLIYLDILPSITLNDFINIFGNAVVGGLERKSDKIIKNILTIFAGIRPVITYDNISGQPKLEFDISNSNEAEKSIQQIFSFISKQNKKIVIAIDEFQRIINYSEKNLEALLRSNIQKLQNATFIFSGSNKGMLLSMFNSYDRPFYQSSEMMYLKEIESTEYINFIKQHFSINNKYINEDNIEIIIKWSRMYTYYIQYLCNKLFSLNLKKYSKEHIDNLFFEILKENEYIYYSYKDLLTDNQFLLLKAIAKEGEVRQANAKKFIQKHKLSTPSSINTTLKTLLEKEMIYSENGTYRVYDVFFSRWLENIS